MCVRVVELSVIGESNSCVISVLSDAEPDEVYGRVIEESLISKPMILVSREDAWVPSAAQGVVRQLKWRSKG